MRAGRARSQIRRYGRSFAVLVALMMLGTASGFYILLQQRLPNPFQNYYSVNAAFPTAAAVVPGLGEPVLVAGVHVGEIAGTSLRGGQGIVHMDIDPGKLPRLYRDASAELVPNTPLKDMQVDIQPGTPAAGVLPAGATITVAQTIVPGRLRRGPGRTGRRYPELADQPDHRARRRTAGSGPDIHALMRGLGPTTAQLARSATCWPRGAGTGRDRPQPRHDQPGDEVKDTQLTTVVRPARGRSRPCRPERRPAPLDHPAAGTLKDARHTLID